jgi:hypothetical protein
MTEKNGQPGKTAGAVGRRTLVKGAAGLGLALGTVQLAGRHTVLPRRMTLDASTLPDIQFDIGAFIAAARTVNDGGGNVTVQLPPVHTVFITAALGRTPTTADQQNLSNALATIESTYQFAAAGILTFIAYGVPYFSRLPGGMTGSLVSSHMPRLAADNSRFALEEALPSPTDVSSANPGLTKQRFNVPVKIERNDLLITLRSDNSTIITDVVAWLGGSNKLNGQSVPSPTLFKGLATVTSSRAQFVGVSLPRNMAETHGFSFSQQVNSDSPMWMGFLDQQTNGAGPAATAVLATSPTCSRAPTTQPTTPRPSTRSRASTGWGTCRDYSDPRAPPTARPSTSAWTAPAWTTWTCPTARTSPSCNSPCSSRPPSSSG